MPRLIDLSPLRGERPTGPLDLFRDIRNDRYIFIIDGRTFIVHQSDVVNVIDVDALSSRDANRLADDLWEQALMVEIEEPDWSRL